MTMRTNNGMLRGAPLLAVACALGLMAAASHADAKKLYAAGAMQIDSVGHQAIDDWTSCSNGQPIFAYAGGYDGANNLVCAIGTRGQTTDVSCPSLAIRHRSWATAGSITLSTGPMVSTWLNSQTNHTTSGVFASSPGRPCASRIFDYASFGGN